MVFHLLVKGVDDQPSATPSSAVFEKYRNGLETVAPPVQVTAHGSKLVVDVFQVDEVRLFRDSGAGAGARGLVGDALPLQRTSALLLVGVPNEVSTGELQEDFFGDGLQHVEGIRVLCREGCGAAASEVVGPPDSPKDVRSSRQSALSGNFYSLVILCKTQAGADMLYEANHGRLFRSKALCYDNFTSTETSRGSTVGPCCYLVFVQSIIYVRLTAQADSGPPGSSAVADAINQIVPSVAYELPACPTCLERLDFSGTGMVTHSQGWLSATMHMAGSCRVCAAIASYGNGVICQTCDLREGIWVCLICSHLGCGRYMREHAKDHATQQRHRFCLELDSGRIWDYSADVFVHRRLVQMAAASGGCFDVTLPAPADGDTVVLSSSSGAHDSGPKQAWPGQDDILAMELDAILASQLDHQRSLYEAMLGDLATQHQEALDREHKLAEAEESRHQQLLREIAEAERQRKALERESVASRKACAEAEERLSFVKELNQSLLANRREIRAAAANGTRDGNHTPQASCSIDPLVQRLREQVACMMEAVSAMEANNDTSRSSSK